jgi:hypothetical protein
MSNVVEPLEPASILPKSCEVGVYASVGEGTIIVTETVNVPDPPFELMPIG